MATMTTIAMVFTFVFLALPEPEKVTRDNKNRISPEVKDEES